MTADPLALRRGENTLGGGAMARGRGKNSPRFERGVVVIYHSATHSALVKTDSGRSLRDVPQLTRGPGDYHHLQVGTSVVVSWDLGYPIIVGCLDFAGAPQSSPTVSITGTEGFGDDDPIQPTTGANNYKPPGAPSDLSGGDWAHVGPLGNHVAVLDGGATLLGAPSAQVRSLAGSGVLQLIARSLHAISDFGTWRTENDQGRTSFVLRAGASQTTETGLDEQHWTIRLDLGAAGGLFDFRVTEPEGRTLFRLHAGADGRVQIYGDGGVDVSTGSGGTGEMGHDVAGNRRTTIAGDDTSTVTGDHAQVVSGSKSTAVDRDRTASVGGDETLFAAGNLSVGVGGKEVHVVTGHGAAVALETRVVNGGWIVDIGNPADGATLSPQAAFALRTHAGDVALDAGRGMMLTAQTSISADAPRINLGRGDHPAPKFDTYLRAEAQFLYALIGVLSGGSTTGGPLVGLAAALPQLQSFAQQVAQGLPFESIKVRND